MLRIYHQRAICAFISFLAFLSISRARSIHQPSPQRSVSSSTTAVGRQFHHYDPSNISSCCCFLTSSSRRLLRRSYSYTATPSSPAQIKTSSSSQISHITATSLFFQRRWKTKRPFLIPSFQHYEPEVPLYNNDVTRQIMQRRGGGLNTPAITAMSAVVTTSEEETVAASPQEEKDDGFNTNNDNNNAENEDDYEENENKMIMIHSYNSTTASVMGLGMPRRQFATWVQYYLSTTSNEDSYSSSATPSSTAALEVEEIMSKVTTQQVHWENDWEEHITTLRQFWNEGKLLVEHTSLLNDRGGMSGIKKKKKKNEEMVGQDGEEVKEEVDDEEEERQIKYDHFKNILGSYADRLVHIVEDELSDETFIPEHEATLEEVTNGSESSTPKWKTRLGMRGWIESEYGIEKTRALMAEKLLVKSEKEQLETFQAFLDWFRDNFPYFHDRCDACGASCNDAPFADDDDDEIVDSNHTEIIGSNNVEEIDLNLESCQHEIEEEDDQDDFSFVGYVGPSPGERMGNASRTELYRCRTCSAFTRFPRYNKALWVTETRRGRCGEYSMLLYRMLRSLGYEKIRWVVDWADHVWVEVLLGDNVGCGNVATEEEEVAIGRWVHLDPCEAAVDNPLLYSSWGKNQTYLMAFYDPYTMSPLSTQNDDVTSIQPVEDVTLRYTNDDIDVVTERRGISEQFVAEAIKEVSSKMKSMLKHYCG